ncbi:hypothetical protein D9619_010297 [Psilocybe cf. subviscida]|uniref:F-box domain-containing protein n=1 Tax=Psilocybe cf. subviscida TaxID=2480587 RepID=A0A8H5ASU1_9AGAR|nr:hypothetical protein D9619_010297 [Psilocybe cf. subviscida]
MDQLVKDDFAQATPNLLTVPTRRAGSRDLSPLPAELYLEIFEHLKPPENPEAPRETHDLRSLAQVCRYFCAVMMPRIFEVVFIDGGADENHSGTSFCQSICNGDQTALTAASHVKIFRITSTSVDLGWSYKEFLSLYAKAILRMRNLVEISLVQTSITNGLLKAIVSLPGLKKLVLQGCNPRKLRQQLLDQLSHLQLETLYVENLDMDEEDDEEHSAPARAFFTRLPLQNVVILKALCPYVSEQILALPPLLNLQDFHALSLRVGVNFPDILSKMPNLKRLEIHSLDFPSSDTIFRGHLPTLHHLQEVCAPMVVLEKVIPGSSISSIEVSYRVHCGSNYDKLSEPRDAEVKLLSKSRRPITSLKVPFSFYTATQFSVAFPALRSLAIRPSHFNYEDGNHAYWLQESVEEVRVPVPTSTLVLTLSLMCTLSL